MKIFVSPQSQDLNYGKRVKVVLPSLDRVEPPKTKFIGLI